LFRAIPESHRAAIWNRSARSRAPKTPEAFDQVRKKRCGVFRFGFNLSHRFRFQTQGKSQNLSGQFLVSRIQKLRPSASVPPRAPNPLNHRCTTPYGPDREKSSLRRENLRETEDTHQPPISRAQSASPLLPVRNPQRWKPRLVERKNLAPRIELRHCLQSPLENQPRDSLEGPQRQQTLIERRLRWRQCRKTSSRASVSWQFRNRESFLSENCVRKLYTSAFFTGNFVGLMMRAKEIGLALAPPPQGLKPGFAASAQ
jgi:hypothetical protein